MKARLFQSTARAVPLFMMVFATWFSDVQSADASEAAGSEPPLKVFLNADLTHAHAVGQSLRIGLMAGLQVGAERYGGPSISVEVRDHRENLRRTERLVNEANGDPATLAIVGGMHTPHYLKYGDAINDADLVLLLPWSAGAILTRKANGPENHIFRVSVDDKKAAPFLAEKAARRGCSSVGTLALDNGWGRGNATALASQLDALGIPVVHEAYVRRDAGEQSIAAAIAPIEAKKPDCIVLVLTAVGSAYSANVFASWDTPPQVLSHWGILGGKFREFLDPNVLSALDLSVLATCILSIEAEQPDRTKEAIAAAGRISAGIEDLHDLESPIAFAHAFDVGLLLTAATVQAQNHPSWQDGRLGRSAALKQTLEALDMTVPGLLKDYVKPFSEMNETAQDAHEALGRSDLCLVRIGKDGKLFASGTGSDH